MGIRAVRLDEETEKVLAQIVATTGLSVSAALKKGLLVLRNDVVQHARRVPYDIYKELDLGAAAQRVGSAAPFEARRVAVELRLGLYQRPIAPCILEPLLAAWRALIGEGLGVVRSSALVEDRAGASFAGQFESFLGVDNEADLVTSVRAWARGRPLMPMTIARIS